jgi:hypothetical protein
VGRGGRSHVGEVVEVVRQAAEAAHALHEAGVVHRDVKPGNVMVSADGRHAVLMDLGLAQLQDETQGRLTQTRQFVGTLRYASPEQLGGATLDRRADVYSLGATLWELLTLRPFLGVTDQTPTPDTILKVQQAEPERVRKHNPRVPADLEAVVVKCLEKDRARRYATAAELAADLGRWQRGEAVLAQPPSLSYLLGKQLRRYRVPLAVAAGVLLAAVAGVVISFVQINDALEREKNAKQEAQDKERDAKKALANERKALADLQARQSQLAGSFCEISDRDFHNGNVLDSVNWMLRAYEVAPDDDPLRYGYRHLLVAQGRSLQGLLFHEGVVTAVAFSPDGKTALTGSHDKTARFWDTASGKMIAKLPHQDCVCAGAFSPDGRTALTGSASTARLWDAASGKLIAEFPHGGEVSAVAFSPDGKTALTGSHDKTARLWTSPPASCAPNSPTRVGWRSWRSARAATPPSRAASTRRPGCGTPPQES